MAKTKNYLSPIKEKDFLKFEKFRFSTNDNYKKAKKYWKLMKKRGFKKLGKFLGIRGGIGTNRLVLYHPKYPNAVYKFALDRYGIDDNFYDLQNHESIKRYAEVFINHPTNVVSVQKRYKPINSLNEIRPYQKSILKDLKRLSEDYVLVDLAPQYNFKNYGIDRDTKKWVYIDASDIVPKYFYGVHIKMNCNRLVVNKKGKVEECCGKLHYIENFHKLKCEDCGYESNPVALKPVFKEVDMSDQFYRSTMTSARLDWINQFASLKSDLEGLDGYESSIPRTKTVKLPVAQLEEFESLPSNGVAARRPHEDDDHEGGEQNLVTENPGQDEGVLGEEYSNEDENENLDKELIRLEPKGREKAKSNETTTGGKLHLDRKAEMLRRLEEAEADEPTPLFDDDDEFEREFRVSQTEEKIEAIREEVERLTEVYPLSAYDVITEIGESISITRCSEYRGFKPVAKNLIMLPMNLNKKYVITDIERIDLVTPQGSMMIPIGVMGLQLRFDEGEKAMFEAIADRVDFAFNTVQEFVNSQSRIHYDRDEVESRIAYRVAGKDFVVKEEEGVLVMELRIPGENSIVLEPEEWSFMLYDKFNRSDFMFEVALD